MPAADKTKCSQFSPANEVLEAVSTFLPVGNNTISKLKESKYKLEFIPMFIPPSPCRVVSN